MEEIEPGPGGYGCEFVVSHVNRLLKGLSIASVELRWLAIAHEFPTARGGLRLRQILRGKGLTPLRRKAL